MARFPKPAEGSWTQHYPELGTGPVSYHDSISPEIYELERNAIFKRAWLNVGRVEQLPRKGSYFTKEMKAANTSIILVRNKSGDINAFHNVCRHRHAWRFDLDGNLTFVQQEEEFFDLDKSRYPLVAVHCEVWEGFIFVNFAAEPEQSLRDFLGPMITNLEGYPFDRLTTRFTYRSEVKANWKLYMDAFQEFYHAPVLHANQSPTAYSKAAAQAGFEAPHYRIEGPHRLVSTSGVRAWEMADEMRKPIDDICHSGLFGPWDAPDLGEMPVGLNPANCDPWGLDSFQLFPNFVVLFWGQGWYLTYHYWPTSHNTHIFECTLYFPQARTPRERLAQELAAQSFKEYGLQDANTLEATQTSIESRVVEEFLLCDQEILLRHLHHETANWIEDYQRKTAGVNA